MRIRAIRSLFLLTAIVLSSGVFGAAPDLKDHVFRLTAGKSQCSAAKISQNLFTTALHCVVSSIEKWDEGKLDDKAKDLTVIQGGGYPATDWLEAEAGSSVLNNDLFIHVGDERHAVKRVFIDRNAFGNPKTFSEGKEYSLDKPFHRFHDRVVIQIEGSEKKGKISPLANDWAFQNLIQLGTELVAAGKNGSEEATTLMHAIYALRTPRIERPLHWAEDGSLISTLPFSPSPRVIYYLERPDRDKGGILTPGSSGGPTFFKLGEEYVMTGIHSGMPLGKDLETTARAYGMVDISTYGIFELTQVLKKRHAEIVPAAFGKVTDPRKGVPKSSETILAEGTVLIQGKKHEFKLEFNGTTLEHTISGEWAPRNTVGDTLFTKLLGFEPQYTEKSRLRDTTSDATSVKALIGLEKGRASGSLFFTIGIDERDPKLIAIRGAVFSDNTEKQLAGQERAYIPVPVADIDVKTVMTVEALKKLAGK